MLTIKHSKNKYQIVDQDYHEPDEGFLYSVTKDGKIIAINLTYEQAVAFISTVND